MEGVDSFVCSSTALTSMLLLGSPRSGATRSQKSSKDVKTDGQTCRQTERQINRIICSHIDVTIELTICSRKLTSASNKSIQNGEICLPEQHRQGSAGPPVTLLNGNERIKRTVASQWGWPARVAAAHQPKM